MVNNHPICSVIVPVYNEEKVIITALKRIIGVFDSDRYEIIVVDDGSQDKTRDILTSFNDQPRLRIINHPENMGKGAALRSGIKIAKGDIIAFCDSDLELNPMELRGLIESLIDKHYDVIYGIRDFWGLRGWQKSLYVIGNRFMNMIGNILFLGKIVDMETGYKVFRRSILTSLNLKCSRFDIEPEITYGLLSKGIRITQHPITYNPRSHNMGKKIRIRDGFMAIFTMLRVRIETFCFKK